MDPPRLGREIAHPVREATLARRSGEAFLDRPDDPGRPVADHEQRIPEPSGAQVLEERPRGLDVLLRARHQPQQRFASVPSCEDGFPPLARPQPLGNAVDEQIDDGVHGEIALAEVLVLGPKLLGDLTLSSGAKCNPRRY